MIKMEERDSGGSIDMGFIGKQTFDNGYGVSVIQNAYSYGGPEGLYELAVITKDGLHYDNPVAKGDVRGYLTEYDVEELIEEVKKFDTYVKDSND